jgi:hypothetical protein
VEQIRRRIYFCRASPRLSASRQNAPVGQQQGCRMVSANPGQARHCCPRPSCRIPHFGFVRGIGHLTVRTLSSSASAGHQDFAVRKQCSIVQFASSRHHRSGVIPSGIRTAQVDDLCGCRGMSVAIGIVKCAWASTHEQYLTLVVHHCRSPITSPVIGNRHRAPITSAISIKVSGCLAGAGTEYLAVRRNKHEWIERLSQVRCAQIAPGSRCGPPYLRLDIVDPRPDRATDHKHVSVGQRGARWIPSTVVHIRQARPCIVQGVISVDAAQSHPVVYVSTGYEELSVGQKRMA